MKFLVICDHYEQVIESDTGDHAKLTFQCGRCIGVNKAGIRVYAATEEDERLLNPRTRR